MSTGLLLLSILPLLGANIWHSILLARPSKDGKPHTISEHAVETRTILKVHRLVHISGAVMLIIFGVGYLLPSGYTIAGWLIIAGAIFDSLQVITLNKQSARPRALSPHTMTAWTMALCYLLYASTIVVAASLGYWFVIAIWLVLAALIAVALFVHQLKSFWISQHLYFWFLALVMMAAQVSLYLE